MPVPKTYLDAVTLGEGNTPIVSLPSVALQLGIESVHAKLEYVNPTGSFKDRGTAVVIAAARQQRRVRGRGGLIRKRGSVRLGLRGARRHEGPHLRSVIRPSGQAQADHRLRSAGALHPRPARGDDRRRRRVCDRARSGVRLPRPQSLLRRGNKAVRLRDIPPVRRQYAKTRRHARRERVAAARRAQGVLRAQEGRARRGNTPPPRRAGQGTSCQ